MTCTNSKNAPQLNEYPKLFVDDIILQIKRKLKENFKKGEKKKSKGIDIRENVWWALEKTWCNFVEREMGKINTKSLKKIKLVKKIKLKRQNW